jgi:hypothetical protein
LGREGKHEGKMELGEERYVWDIQERKATVHPITSSARAEGKDRNSPTHS